MDGSTESNLSESARRAYEQARLAFTSAPTVHARAWQGTLERRAAEHAGTERSTHGAPHGAAHTAAGSQSDGHAVRSTAQNHSDASFARGENEDDDGYDPWSDRVETPPFWEEDPWR